MSRVIVFGEDIVDVKGRIFTKDKQYEITHEFKKDNTQYYRINADDNFETYVCDAMKCPYEIIEV